LPFFNSNLPGIIPPFVCGDRINTKFIRYFFAEKSNINRLQIYRDKT